MAAASVKISKKQTLIDEVNKIVRQYRSKLTLRQIYYRLVASQAIENKLSNYKYLSRILVDARKNNLVDSNIFEDRTRTFSSNQYKYRRISESISDLLDMIRTEADYYSLPRMLYQDDVAVVALEKQALEGVFKPICLKLSAYFVVCRGYNSYTQLRDMSHRLKKEKKKLHLYFFSDHDPTGVDIERNFISQMNQLGCKFETIERVALTEQQIQQYNLPDSPVKKSDSRARNWSGGVVELDALDPSILEDLVRKSIEKTFDQKIYTEVTRLERVLKRRLQRKIERSIKI